jgi:osmotically-inducible protein OsmY
MMKPALAALFLAASLAASCSSSRNLDKSFSDIGADADLKVILFADRTHDYGDVDITVYEGRLLLTGTMRSDEGKERLLENAWKAEGVEQVIDEVLVASKTPFSQGVRDSRIDAAIKARFLTDDAVKSSNYKISVSSGVVYLLGVTRSQASLDSAIAIARSTKGVDKVVSHVLVKRL